ncbi:DUF3388 domain-containing protein [Mammaliicoccus stepanovicii]|uniref:ACT domain protein n=1 Tax=Mammaliicoccus stepanovicii TaxID=643214 RepID=A0A239ZG49_9STAP|nr:DUF3388 domain-containing protein [Mammaliicoccus stepanovicii]PNZ79050.1 DUF3388 domain-containing protein [Mammaliicoccus stepanovicii]GGI41862.1 hypothetical protein GCM10010896_15540 [Mammaliicoccus stepanovicii]SNV70135.1 ACT domain protein [Mammaliicoccus stepanovicii]
MEEVIKKEWYLEYDIQVNRAGLLGDISSLLGILGINIITINGVDQGRRGLLIKTDNMNKVKRFENIVREIDDITIKKLRTPGLRDRLAVRHGRYIKRDVDDKKTFRFERKDLGILVDFMAELFKEDRHKLIGVRGMPRVGKTESVVAASVCAHKKWLFISSTLIKQTVRSSLLKGEYSDKNVYIIDGAVTSKQTDEKHKQLVREVMNLPTIKVVEHPDLFVQRSEYSLDDFDYIIELREKEDQEITYEQLNKNDLFTNDSMTFGDGFGFFE